MAPYGVSVPGLRVRGALRVLEHGAHRGLERLFLLRREVDTAPDEVRKPVPATEGAAGKVFVILPPKARGRSFRDPAAEGEDDHTGECNCNRSAIRPANAIAIVP